MDVTWVNGLIYELPIFSGFRSASPSSVDNVESIYSAVEPLLSLRNCSFPNECKDSITLNAYVPVVRALESKLDKVTQAGPKAKRIYLKDLRRSFVLLAPMVEAAAWVRWLDLEKGLSLALQAENLVAAAMLTRSLAEEAIRGLAIRKSLRLLFHYEEGKKYDQQRLLQIGRAFTDWALPATTQLDAAEAAGKSRQPKRNQENASIDDVRKRLNDYVHPNYGSNRITHAPAESKVFEIIGEALHKIYERFTTDCWLNCSKAVRATRHAEKAHINPDEFVRNLSPRETSGLSQTLLSKGLATLRKENQKNWDLDIAIEAGFDFSAAEALVTEASLHQERLELTRSAPGVYPLYDPQLTIMWCCAKSALENASADVGKELSAIERLSGLISAFSLLTDVKQLLILSALRGSIQSYLPIASAVLARALLEFHAVAVWLRLQLEEIIKHPIDDVDADFYARLEFAISSVLVGTYATEEHASQLRVVWAEKQGGRAIDLNQAMNVLSEGERFEYDLFSHIVHGTRRKGMDLWGEGGRSVKNATLARCISVVGIVSHVEQLSSRLPIKSLLRLQKIGELARAGESVEQAQRTTTVPDQMVADTDIFGTGTEWDPFRFRDGLNYYEALYSYLATKDMLAFTRQLHIRTDNVLLDQFSSSEHSKFIFFEPPNL